MWAALALSVDEAEEAAVTHKIDVHGMTEERARRAGKKRIAENV